MEGRSHIKHAMTERPANSQQTPPQLWQRITMLVSIGTTAATIFLFQPRSMTLRDGLLVGVVASIGGVIFWNTGLWFLKSVGIEPPDLPRTGGRHEPRAWGGLVFGATYFLWVCLPLAVVDMQVYGDSRSKALLANGTALALIGAGSAVFYGASIRGRITALGWDHHRQETVIAFLWVLLLLGPALTGYSVLIHERRFEALAAGGFATVVAAGMMAVAVLWYCHKLQTSHNDPKEAGRGTLAGVLIILLTLAAHECVRHWADVVAAIARVLDR